MRVLIVLLWCAALLPCAAAGADAVESPSQSTMPGWQEHPEQDVVRAALVDFYARVQAGQRDEAVALCHSTTEAERVMALAMTALLRGQIVCRSVTQVSLGADVADEAFRSLITVEEIQAAKVEIRGDHARLTFRPGASFRLVNVDGTWKLSMHGTCVQEKQSALVLASGYAQMAQAYAMTVKDIQSGNLRKASEIEASIQVNVDLIGEQMRAKQKAHTRAE
jgi:hypothetical protein